MKKEIKLNSIAWLALILLMLISTLFSENKSLNLFKYIVILTSIKFLLVTFQFMEVKHAHLIWKIVGVIIPSIYTIGILHLIQ